MSGRRETSALFKNGGWLTRLRRCDWLGLVARRQTEHEDILSEEVQEETAGRSAQNTEEDRTGTPRTRVMCVLTTLVLSILSVISSPNSKHSDICLNTQVCKVPST